MYNINNDIGGGESRDILERLVGDMLNRCIESGMVRKDEMIIILEDMIQSIERGTLRTVLEYA